MNEDFVTYELAVKLKEKGFDIPFYFFYRSDDKLIHHAMVGKPLVYCDKIDDEVVCAPTIPQVLKWLREEKGWVIVVRLYSTNGWYWFVQDEKGELKSSHLASCDDCFSTYEQAALAGIEYVLDNLI